MKPVVNKLSNWLIIAAMGASLSAYASPELSVTIDPSHELDPSIVSVIAGPVDFNVILIDESTVEFSWNSSLLDGSSVDYFEVWDRDQLLVRTEEDHWQLSGMDRNDSYDFSVSAVTASGETTRRSSRVYYDLPQLDINLPDGGNHYLPPLSNLKAEVIDADSVRLTWDAAESFWSWADPSQYSYFVSLGGSTVEVVDEPGYTFTGLAGQGLVWVGVRAYVEGEMYSRQPNQVLVDTSNPADTVSDGLAGFNSLFGLRTGIYSNTAAELFWQRSTLSALTSQVYINGRLVARLDDGNSLYLEDLPPGERLLVSVGEGWPEGGGSSNGRLLGYDYPLMHAWIEMPSYGLGDDGSDVTFEPVTGLRVDVYSSTAAEVFWDRSDIPLASYRILINGEFLQETTATSLFLDELASGSQFTVGVSFVDSDGLASDVKEVGFETSGELAKAVRGR